MWHSSRQNVFHTIDDYNSIMSVLFTDAKSLGKKFHWSGNRKIEPVWSHASRIVDTDQSSTKYHQYSLSDLYILLF